MTYEINIGILIELVSDTLKTTSNSEALSADVTNASQLGSPIEWDSLSFVAVLLAVSQHYNVDVDDDDAMSFMSIQSISKFLQEVL